MAAPADPIADTRSWLERAVIGLNLCPFAKAVYIKQQVRLVCSDATTPDALLVQLGEELLLLRDTPPEQVDTTLLVHPAVLGDFLDYNDFLDEAEALVDSLGLEGVIQVASFHPDYRFADAPGDDIGNCSNRSPHPMLHLLREDSIARALQSAADPQAASDAIVERNLETLRRLGPAGWRQLWDRPPG